MNCQEALSLLYEIIDKEASEVDIHQVKDHLKKCGHCSEIYRVEQEVNAFLKARCNDHQPAERLEELKSRVAMLLDREDGAGTDPLAYGGDRKHGAPHITGLRYGRYVAAAAALVVVVWGAFLAADLFRHHDEHYALEQIHLDAGQHAATFAGAEDTGRAMRYCAGHMHYVPIETVNGYTLVGAREIEVHGATAVHLLYANGSSHVSVFLLKADQFSIPDSLKTAPTTRGNYTFYDHHCRGCRLVYHEVGNLIVITATEQHTVDLLDFIPGAAA
ncbi:MAG: zf-HC2 domain-containing protein [candidate division Zixibacteria bacterium]|jgi:mycothiol system anti-sigma-R factor|nr:zf-HC2 domain-containing protein [candidate division Zixibacteria bacterium]